MEKRPIMSCTQQRPLDGIRVVELGQLLAGPFTGTILAYFGAEVIKVEPPGGDPIRGWRQLRNGTSLWYRSLGRNKKSVVLDLRSERGRELAADLMAGADVVIENFRPGLMEKWGLGPDAMKARNPGLVYTRISGYGQTGPYAEKPGYASVTEAFGGFRYLNGEPGKAPVRPNISLGDTLAALHAALGIAACGCCILVEAGVAVALSLAGDFDIDLPADMRVSIYPLERLEFLSSQGLAYPLTGLTLMPGLRTGTSNRALGGPVRIRTAPDSSGVYLLVLPLKALDVLISASL